MTKLEFIKFHTQRGGHFFDKGATNFFKSRINLFDEVTGIFITSECGAVGKMPRVYTIRKADFQTGQVSTIGELGEYKDYYQAKNRYLFLTKKGGL